jgi:SAM-dependent methyltransferase
MHSHSDQPHWLAAITHRFLLGVLPEGGRVLEVGCGRGHVARLLGADGFRVTALDLRIEEPRPWPHVRYEQRDFLGFEDEPYDAVVFTSSLHHLFPLDAAIDRTVKLLSPGGLLIADEMDLAAPDEATCRWNYARTGEDGGVERWREDHAHDPPLHTGAQMSTAIRAGFEITDLWRGPSLYRMFGERAAEVRTAELIAIGSGEIRPVGLRIVAQRGS